MLLKRVSRIVVYVAGRSAGSRGQNGTNWRAPSFRGSIPCRASGCMTSTKPTRASGVRASPLRSKRAPASACCLTRCRISPATPVLWRSSRTTVAVLVAFCAASTCAAARRSALSTSATVVVDVHWKWSVYCPAVSTRVQVLADMGGPTQQTGVPWAAICPTSHARACWYRVCTTISAALATPLSGRCRWGGASSVTGTHRRCSRE
mmetsp:Transcript_38446/g.63921  ORF Transcript_38446/g.63921 Transcript_38446/m.63921 type:complete len:206 (+) Transcript_38446:555-1172(+)